LSVQLVTILILLAVFLVATVLPVHMGALALTATFVAAYFIYGSGDYADSVFGFFPGSLFVVLVGVTYLFAIAKNNGTVDWLVHAAVKASGGRLGAIPWAMFTVTAALTAIGGVVPAVVAIIAPVGMSFARRYSINPVLMGLFIINGATAGGFSPLSIFGVIVNTVVKDNDLPGNPLFLWFASIVINILLSIGVFFLFGGRALLGAGRVEISDDHDDDFVAATVAGDATEGTGEDIPGGGARAVAVGSVSTAGAALSGGRITAPGHGQPGHQHSTAEDRADQRALQTTALAPDHAERVTSLDRDRVLTLVGLVVLVVGSLPPFKLDIGLMAISVGVVLSLVAPRRPDRLADRAADLRDRHLRRPDAGPGHPRVARRQGGHAGRAADRRPADLLHRCRRLRLRLHHRHPGRADPAGGALPAGQQRGGRGRPDHRAGAVVVDRRLEPLLHQRRPRGRQRHRAGAGRRVQDAEHLGLLDGGDHPAGHLAGAGRPRLALKKDPVLPTPRTLGAGPGRGRPVPHQPVPRTADPPSGAQSRSGSDGRTQHPRKRQT
jgi:dicarboxylate carrier protein MatC